MGDIIRRKPKVKTPVRSQFQSFLGEECKLLARKYPFLTAQQIRQKAKHEWKQLSNTDKKRCSDEFRSQAGGARIRISTPKKTSKFFKSTALPSDIVPESTDNGVEPSPDFQRLISSKTYQYGTKWTFQKQCVPEIVEDDLSFTQGILVRNETERRKSGTRVSFTSPPQYGETSESEIDEVTPEKPFASETATQTVNFVSFKKAQLTKKEKTTQNKSSQSKNRNVKQPIYSKFKSLVQSTDSSDVRKSSDTSGKSAKELFGFDSDESEEDTKAVKVSAPPPIEIKSDEATELSDEDNDAALMYYECENEVNSQDEAKENAYEGMKFTLGAPPAGDYSQDDEEEDGSLLYYTCLEDSNCANNPDTADFEVSLITDRQENHAKDQCLVKEQQTDTIVEDKITTDLHQQRSKIDNNSASIENRVAASTPAITSSLSELSKITPQMPDTVVAATFAKAQKAPKKKKGTKNATLKPPVSADTGNHMGIMLKPRARKSMDFIENGHEPVKKKEFKRSNLAGKVEIEVSDENVNLVGSVNKIFTRQAQTNCTPEIVFQTKRRVNSSSQNQVIDNITDVQPSCSNSNKNFLQQLNNFSRSHDIHVSDELSSDSESLIEIEISELRSNLKKRSAETISNVLYQLRAAGASESETEAKRVSPALSPALSGLSEISGVSSLQSAEMHFSEASAASSPVQSSEYAEMIAQNRRVTKERSMKYTNVQADKQKNITKIAIKAPKSIDTKKQKSLKRSNDAMSSNDRYPLRKKPKLCHSHEKLVTAPKTKPASHQNAVDDDMWGNDASQQVSPERGDCVVSSPPFDLCSLFRPVSPPKESMTSNRRLLSSNKRMGVSNFLQLFDEKNIFS